jgi:hypothetical protein
MVNVIVTQHTCGPKPKVTVIQDEKPEGQS